jgi:hypothetical protein
VRASNEAAVDIAFNMNVISSISTYFNIAFPGRISFEHQESACGGKPDHSMWVNGKAIFFSETKIKWNISSNDLVKDYRKDLKKMHKTGTPSPLINAVERVFRYLGGGNLQFGAISTYDYTWFLKRPKSSPGCLQVSDRIANSSIGPSVLKCHTHAISLAMENPDSPRPPHSKRIDMNENNRRQSDNNNDPKNQNQKTSNGGTNYNIIRRGGVPGAGTKRASLESYGWNDYEIMDVLGCGRSGAV